MDVVSDSGEEDIRVLSNALTDFADPSVEDRSRVG